MCGERRRWLVTGLLALFALPLAARADEPGQGIMLIDVDAVELDNRGNPMGYRQVVLEFRVKNLDSGKKYTRAVTSERSTTLLHLPAGRYCLYAVVLPFGGTLDYCKEPYFSVRPGKVSNVGAWRFGVSHDAGTYRLMHAFEDQARVLQEAIQTHPELFEAP